MVLCTAFLAQDAATPTLKSVVALLKLGDWDPDVFYKFRDTILNQVTFDALARPYSTLDLFCADNKTLRA